MKEKNISKWGAGMAQWWERSPPTNVSVCFLRVLRFSPPLKNQYFQIPIRSGIVKHFIMSLWLGWLRKHSLCLTLNLHLHFMKESTSFFSLFSPSNETFMKVCENSKELCKHRPWTNVFTFAFSFSQTPTCVQFLKFTMIMTLWRQTT